jgi:hypothetical protein
MGAGLGKTILLGRFAEESGSLRMLNQFLDGGVSIPGLRMGF